MFPFETIITIDRNLKLPVYRQIAVNIIQAVRNGVLKPGTPLLSSREMARLLGVHRKTVIAAYDELNAQDWITIIPRKQVHISEKIPLLNPQKWEKKNKFPLSKFIEYSFCRSWADHNTPTNRFISLVY